MLALRVLFASWFCLRLLVLGFSPCAIALSLSPSRLPLIVDAFSRHAPRRALVVSGRFLLLIGGDQREYLLSVDLVRR